MERATLGQFIAALRKDAGMTQKQLAEILNVSDKTISHWERDESSPDLSMIPIIAQVFGVTCDELLGGERRGKEESKPPEKYNLFSEKDVFEKAKSFNGAYNVPKENKPKKSSVNEMTLHKILCAVAAGICAFALFKVENYVLQLGSLPGMNDMIPGFFGVAFFFSVCIYFVISAVILCVSHVKIKSTLNADDNGDEKIKESMLLANKLTAYSGLFLCLSVLTTLVQLIIVRTDYFYIGLLIMLAVELIAAIITVVSLKHKGLIAGKKRSEQSRKDFKFRLTAFVTALVFAAVGVGVQLCVGFLDRHYDTEPINRYDFIEYMETYKPLPEKYKKLAPVDKSIYQSYMTTENDDTPVFNIAVPSGDEDYVEVTTVFDSSESGTHFYYPFFAESKSKLSFVDSYLYDHQEVNEKDFEPIFRLHVNGYVDNDGNETTVHFKWRNHEVKCFETGGSMFQYSVHTYESYNRTVLINKLSNITYHLAFVYYPAVAVICIIVCIAVPIRRRKRAEAEE